MSSITIGQSIWRQRKKHGMTQVTLANIIGVPSCYISWWETGRYCPSIFFAVCLADVFGISLDELVGRVVASK
jgi:DNA-binding XRE family transcriptional regulator